jgi:acetyltransferase-like isoleucine patch superfamily enzyme
MLGLFLLNCAKTFINWQTKQKAMKNPHIQVDRSATIFSYEHIWCKNGLIKIGKNTWVNRMCAIIATDGKIEIGNNVLIGPGTTIYTVHHNFERTDVPIKLQGNTEKPIIIEDDVWIGANCTIVGGTRIGAHSVIGAQSFVKGNIPPYSVAYGVPCRVKRSRLEPKSSDVNLKPQDRLVDCSIPKMI